MITGKIIGFCGYGTTGKDETAKVLIKHYGFQRIALADPLKEMARAIGWNGTKDDRPPCECCGMLQGRPLLQKMGTEAIRENLGEDIWVNVALGRMNQFPEGNYAITDVRFPNEASLLQAHGATIVRIRRPGFDVGFDHDSEALIDEIIHDLEINNDGTLKDLENKVLNLVENKHLVV